MTALRIPRRAALAAITALVAAASLTSFAESYRGLYLWAHGHGLAGVWAAAWPLQVDVFIAVGELALFVALADRWAARSRVAAWTVTLAGLAVSVAENVGHVGGHSPAAHVTAAVPPLAAPSALALGLDLLKRVVAHVAVSATQTPAVPRAASVHTNGHTTRARAVAAESAAESRYADTLAAGQCRVCARSSVISTWASHIPDRYASTSRQWPSGYDTSWTR